jgi:hypothetical protein
MSPQFWIFWVIVIVVTALVGLFWKLAELRAGVMMNDSGGGANAAEEKRNRTGRRWRRVRPNGCWIKGLV